MGDDRTGAERLRELARRMRTVYVREELRSVWGRWTEPVREP